MTKANEASPSPAMDVAAHYDATMYQAVFLEYYGHSQFSNFGYWDEPGQDQRGACDALMSQVLNLLPSDCEPHRILDVACGKGATTRALRERFPTARVAGVNISAKQLGTAAGEAPACGFAAMDAVHLGFRDDSFDLVVCVEAAFHFLTRERFFAEAHRILKPRGVLLVSDLLMNREAEGRLPYRTVENFVADPAAYQALLQSAGFVATRVRDVTRECWHGCYWNMVRLAHQRLLERRIDAAQLRTYLEKAYRMVTDIEWYLLAAGRKGNP